MWRRTLPCTVKTKKKKKKGLLPFVLDSLSVLAYSGQVSFEPWRLTNCVTILLRFVTHISPLEAFLRGCLSFDSARRSEAACVLQMLHFSEKHVYRGCQSTNEPEASEGESSRTGNSRLNPNSNKRQIVVSNETKYLLRRKLIM